MVTGHNPGATASSSARAAAAAASYGSDTGGHIGGSASAGSRAPSRGPSGVFAGDGNGGKFLDVKVAGRADSTAGTGSCASLVMHVGEVEAWALGGAATRWVERLGPEVSD